jgi:hypothetical protein
MADESVRESSDFEKHYTHNVGSANVEECSRSLIITNKGSFKWSGEFEALQTLFDDILKSQTSWSKPGGSCRKLEIADQLIVRWYSDSHSLTLNGSKDEDIKTCLRELAKEAVEHDMNTSNSSFENQEDSPYQIKFDGEDKSLESLADVSAKITAEDLTMILEKIEKIEQKLERKIDDVSLEVCKLQDTDCFALTLSREHISFIKDENVQLKAENVYLKNELENATLVMSDLNEHVKLMGEEKQSLITALKILKNNEIDDGRNERWHIASDRNNRRSHSSNQLKYQLTVKTIIFQQTDIRNLPMKPY